MSLNISDPNKFLSNSQLQAMKEVADLIFCEREKTNKKINVKIVCNTEMQELNKTFRNKDKNTNVLAFVNDEESKEQTQEFGDIAICYPYLEEEAASQGKSINDHISHMLIHGILHIFGHDHTKTTQRKDMEKEEIRILKKLKIGDPYLL